MFEFHVLTLGQFSRNKFWGELDSQSYREPVCTSTLVKGEGNRNLIVDPSLPPERMAKVLYDRSGLKLEDINFVFISHSHGDHFVGIELFQKAAWFMGAAELEIMGMSDNAHTREFAQKFIPVHEGNNSEAVNSGLNKSGLNESKLPQGIEFLSLPGHTLGSMGILFDSRDGRVCICGDAVMTRDFFDNRQGYYNSADFEKSASSIQKLSELCDIVVPGHDNYFLTGRK